MWCVVCSDNGCEHCPNANVSRLGPTLETEMALVAVRGSVAFAIDKGADPLRVRREVEIAMSEWCDEQGEPPVSGECRLDRFGRPC